MNEENDNQQQPEDRDRLFRPSAAHRQQLQLDSNEEHKVQRQIQERAQKQSQQPNLAQPHSFNQRPKQNSSHQKQKQILKQQEQSSLMVLERDNKPKRVVGHQNVLPSQPKATRPDWNQKRNQELQAFEEVKSSSPAHIEIKSMVNSQDQDSMPFRTNKKQRQAPEEPLQFDLKQRRQAVDVIDSNPIPLQDRFASFEPRQAALIRPIEDEQNSEKSFEEPEELRCECQFCHNMVFMSDLDAHEQACEQSLSSKHINEILDEQPPPENTSSFVSQGSQRNIFERRPVRQHQFSTNQNQVQQRGAPAFNQRRTGIPIVEMVPNRGINRYQEPADQPEEQKQPQVQTPITFMRTTHPSGVVPQPNRRQNSNWEPREDGDGARENIEEPRQFSIDRNQRPLAEDSKSSDDELDQVTFSQTAVNKFLEEAVRQQEREEQSALDDNQTFGLNLVHQQHSDNSSEEEQEFVYHSEQPGSRRYQQENDLAFRAQIQQPRGSQRYGSDSDPDSEEGKMAPELTEALQRRNPNMIGVPRGQQASIMRYLGAILRGVVSGRDSQIPVDLEDDSQFEDFDPNAIDPDVVRQQLEAGDSEEDPEYEDLLELDEDLINPVPKEIIESLPVSKFTEANKQNFSEENKSCTICQCQYEPAEEYIILPCLHRFHSECVSTWFDRQNTCPICKNKICEDNPQPDPDAEVPNIQFEVERNNHFAGRRHIQVVQLVGGERQSRDRNDVLQAFADHYQQQDARQRDIFQQQSQGRRPNFNPPSQINNMNRDRVGLNQFQYRGVRQILDEDEDDQEPIVSHVNRNIFMPQQQQQQQPSQPQRQLRDEPQVPNQVPQLTSSHFQALSSNPSGYNRRRTNPLFQEDHDDQPRERSAFEDSFD